METDWFIYTLAHYLYLLYVQVSINLIANINVLLNLSNIKKNFFCICISLLWLLHILNIYY